MKLDMHLQRTADPILLLKIHNNLRCFLRLDERDLNFPKFITMDHEHWSTDWWVLFTSADVDVSH